MFKKIWHHWKIFAFKVGEFNFKVIMTLFYFVILTFFAIPFKLTNDILMMKKKYISFWRDRKTGYTLESTKEQF